MLVKLMRVTLCLLLALALFLPVGPIGGTDSILENSFIVIEKAPPVAERIAPEVRASFSEDDYVEVLVKMTRQVDTARVAEVALQKASPNRQGRIEVRAAVVDELRANAAAGQKKIIQYLQQQQHKGNVLEFRGFYIVNLVYVKATPAVVELLAYRADVQLILPNTEIVLELPEIVGDGGEFTTQSVEWGVSRINAPDVWTMGYEGEGVVVGVIDTGVDWQHEALKENWRGYDPADPDHPDPSYNWYDPVYGTVMPCDMDMHGTHVTGTIVGSSQIGVAPGARWIAANAFHNDPDFGVIANSSNLLAAAQYMLAPTDSDGLNPRPDLAPDIINNSWGGSAVIDDWFRPAVQAWRDAQILPVIAAGNSGPSAGTVAVPANYPESFAVAATDINNNLASFSSRGPGAYGDDIKPEISAPGVNVLSSVPGGGYAAASGTSMAAPHVAGVAALLRSANPLLTVDELEQTMIDTAVPLTDTDYPVSPNYGYGYGLVDALASLNSLQYGYVTGQVLVEGIDNEDPVIEHTQEVSSSFTGVAFPLEASVSDNVAVSAVKAMVSTTGDDLWSEIPMYRYAGDHRSGEYWGAVPWNLVEEPGLEYKIVAVDFAGNQAETAVFEVDVKFGLGLGWSEDFSSEPLYWEWDGDWEWGIPTVGPAPQIGDHLMATNLSGDHSSNSESYLWTPPLDLRNAESPALRLDHWYQFDDGEGLAGILITDDGGANWNGYAWSGDSDGWQTSYLSLDQFAGSSEQVFVLFFFISEGGTVYPGWYIDHVSVGELAINEQDVFYADFEQDSGGFTIELLEGGFVNSWDWGIPTSGPGSAYSGSKLWATNLSGDYPYWSGSILWSPVISLDGLENAYLEFWHWFSIEPNWNWSYDIPYDGGMVLYHTPEDNETISDGYWFYGDKSYWSNEIYNLDYFISNNYSQIQVGFWFHSDDWFNYPGWYIDDVRLFTYSLDIQLLQAGPSPAWVHLDDIDPMRPDNLDAVKKQEPGEGPAPSPAAWEVDREIPFREPLQGPEPLVQTLENSPQLLPLEATVTVLETGVSVATDAGDGTYRLEHSPTELGETLTLQVTSPGYEPAEEQFTLAIQETLVFDFILQPSSLTPGDVNDDGKVTVVDAILVLRSLVDLIYLNPQQEQAADLNQNGEVDVGDAILILRHAAGKD